MDCSIISNPMHQRKKVIDIPTFIIIFGATGDLNRKKLIPAVFDLYSRGLLPKPFSIVGFSSDTLTDDDYKSFVREIIEEDKHNHPSKKIKEFIENIFYIRGDFGDAASFENLSKFLFQKDERRGVCSNKLYYLSAPPDSYKDIFNNLADSGLSVGCNDHSGWARIVVEKPFGKDLETARSLDETLGLLFKEQRIFRIDHYLAKEAIENILAFRFSNSIFQPIWNSSYVERVEIKLFEDLGIEGRGSFYDQVGALRDVGENHMLQMLAIIAMEDPVTIGADQIRRAREKVLSSLRPFSKKEARELCIKGQYDGFLKEQDVKENSQTDTYFRIEAFIDNDRWYDVPFILEAGKKMDRRKTEITMYFKELPSCVCEEKEGSVKQYRNVLRFSIQPKESISVRFWAKVPGFGMELEPQFLQFSYKEETDIPSAYEKLLLNVFEGDQTLFVSSKEVEASWEFITPILKIWSDQKPVVYAPGSSFVA